MTGCAAPDCTNSDEKGFIMKIFPRDPVRRAQWVANVRRQGWVPTDRSFLCEVHFSHDMWENKRVDGKRKLKPYAVPTIFGSEAKKIKSHRENVSASLNNNVDCDSNRDTSVQSIQNKEKNNDCEDELLLESAEKKKNDNKFKDMSRTIKKQNQIISEQSRCIKRQSIKLQKYYKRILMAQYNIKALKSEKKRNEKRSNYAFLLSKMREIFTDDQIAVLKNSRVQWSNESIKKALRLQFCCGITGYEELRRQKIPLPGPRTLRRRLENLKFENGTSDDILNFLKLKGPDWDEIDKDVV